MRRLILLILTLLLMAGSAFGYDVLLVQSSRNAAYDEAVRSFRSSVNADCRTVVLSDYADADMARLVREEHPRVVLAVGDEAFASVKKVRQTPVIALMTLGVNRSEGRPNVAGVSLFASPESYLPVFKAMKASRIGMVYDPARTGWYVRRAMAAARAAGLTIVAREAGSPQEAVTRLAELGGNVDALWLVPDTTTVGRETLYAYFDFSLRQKVPVVSFAANHLRQGAAAVVEIDISALGRQAAEMAGKALGGASRLPVESPRSVTIKVNGSVMKNLGFSPELMGQFVVSGRDSSSNDAQRVTSQRFD